MKTNLSGLLLILLFLASLPAEARSAENPIEVIEAARSEYKAQRQSLIAEEMQLTESESLAFWPLYRAYRADTDRIFDSMVKLILDYAAVYPNVPEETATSLLKRSMEIEKEQLEKRQLYLKRAGKMLPASKVFRWAQLERRLDFKFRLAIANAIPLSPTASQKP